jgi:hypothetical protein
MHRIASPAESGLELAVGDVAEPQPGRQTRVPQDLGEPHVSDPRHDSLIEEDVAEQSVGLGRANSGEKLCHRMSRFKEVGPEVRRTAAIEGEDWPVPLARLPAFRAQDEPRSTGPRARVPFSHAPASVHPEVAPNDDTAFEPEQQVLADGID